MGHRTAYNRRRRRHRRGGVLIYVTVAMTLLIGITSLAVDWGRVQLAKTELERGTDAAARYAVLGVSDGTALAKANSLANDNTVDGTPLTFAPADVETGTWSNNTFTPGAGGNAVRVTGRRTAATGNPVALTIAQIIGYKNCDVVAKAVATRAIGGYGVVGLNYINMGGNSSDSYWSNSASPGTGYGAIASNGDITLTGSSSIHGDARPGVGKAVYGASAVSGSTAPLTSPLSYPNATTPATNDNAQIPNGAMSANSMSIGKNKTLTLSAGTYVVQDFSMGANSSLILTGPVTLYVFGNASLGGTVNTNSNLAQNFNLVMGPKYDGTPPGTLTIGGTAALYANIYAPQSDVTLSGTGDIYGAVLGQSISMTGTSAIHYDLSLKGNNGAISLVR